MLPTYLLSVLHFNLQYCAGGIGDLVVNWPTDEISIEDQIIEESFQPVLDLLDRHPTWTFGIELQAYMIEVMADRHPETLDQLRRLAKSGQVELISFHYSDQLWVAYPFRDAVVSIDRTREVFAANDLPLSPVVFTQEGQFGESAARYAFAHGYDAFVLPHNLAEYWWGAEPTDLVFRLGDGYVLSGGTGVTTDTYAAYWHFLNDGELYATNGMNCYLGGAFVYNEAATAQREAELVAAEDAGARITGIETFLAEVAPDDAPELPPTPDGTWQPDDTENTYLWMGGSGLWGAEERDNLVRTTVMAARHAVAAAETVPGADAALVAEAWDEALLAEVSDATGWNPYPTEVAYAFEHADNAVALATRAVAPACEGADHLVVEDGVVTPDGEVEEPEGTPVDAPFEVALPGRPATVTWTRLNTVTRRVRVAFEAGEGPPAVEFPWGGHGLATIPAMANAIVEFPIEVLHRDRFGVALPLGLARLADQRWLVLRTDTVHLAAVFTVPDGKGGGGTVRFADETDPGEASTWEFRLVDSHGDRARELAYALNVHPPVRFDCPEPVVEDPADPIAGPDCGCAATRPAPAGLLLALLASAAARRRQSSVV